MALSSPLKRLARRRLRRAYFSAFDSVVVSSRLEQVEIGDARGPHTVVIAYGVRGIAPCTRSSTPRSALRVGFLARIHTKKDLDLLIEAVVAILGNEVEVVVAGGGPTAYVQHLKRLARYEATVSGIIRAIEKRVKHGCWRAAKQAEASTAPASIS